MALLMNELLQLSNKSVLLKYIIIHRDPCFFSTIHRLFLTPAPITGSGHTPIGIPRADGSTIFFEWGEQRRIQRAAKHLFLW